MAHEAAKRAEVARQEAEEEERQIIEQIAAEEVKITEAKRAEEARKAAEEANRRAEIEEQER